MVVVSQLLQQLPGPFAPPLSGAPYIYLQPAPSPVGMGPMDYKLMYGLKVPLEPVRAAGVHLDALPSNANAARRMIPKRQHPYENRPHSRD